MKICFILNFLAEKHKTLPVILHAPMRRNKLLPYSNTPAAEFEDEESVPAIVPRM